MLMLSFSITINWSPFSLVMILSKYFTPNKVISITCSKLLPFLAMHHFFASGDSFFDFAPTLLLFEVSKEQLSHNHLNLTPLFVPYRLVV